MSNALSDEVGEEAGEEEECHKSYVSRSEGADDSLKKKKPFSFTSLSSTTKTINEKRKSDLAAPLCPQL